MQNPLTMCLGRNAETIKSSQNFVLEIAKRIQKLNPRLVYLIPGEVETTLRYLAQIRPPEWLDFVIAYRTQQGYGKVQGWQGFAGLVKFYEMRLQVELGLLARLPFPVLAVEHTDWDQDYARIEGFLGGI